MRYIYEIYIYIIMMSQPTSVCFTLVRSYLKLDVQPTRRDRRSRGCGAGVGGGGSGGGGGRFFSHASFAVEQLGHDDFPLQTQSW